MAVLVIVIIVAILFGILGALVKGLLWLLFVGIVLFVGAALYGAARTRIGSR